MSYYHDLTEQSVQAQRVQEGDFLPGLDNGFVFQEPERNVARYLAYPRGHYDASPDVAMPENTIIIAFHDADGEECYLLMPAESRLIVRGEARDEDEED